MEQVEMFLVFTDRLEQAGMNYMATGSVASMLYGIPRFTHDLDLVMELPPSQIQSITDSFPLSEFYCPPPEVLQIESRRSRRGHFNIIHHTTGFKADVYLHGSDDLQEWGLSKKRRIDLSEGKGIWAAPPEYVIVRKLEYYREGHAEKHLQDIRGMLEISGDLMDHAAIQAWVKKLDLLSQWNTVAP